MAITVRELDESDLELVMNWRMDPDVTQYMNTNPKLTIEGQRQWLASLQQNEKVIYWIIEQNGEPVGIIDLFDIDWESRTSSWGYYIGEKKARSLKLAISLEMSLYDYVFDVLGLDELHNEVFSLNSGVIKLHQACGSHIVKEVKGEVEKEGILYDITHISITKNEWNKIKLSKKYDHINFDFLLIPHHIGYAVADIQDALCKFKQLGFYQCSKVYCDTDRNVKIVFIKNMLNNLDIELIAPLNSGKSPVTDLLKEKKNVSNPYHICYSVKSIEKSIAILKKRGFVLTTFPAKAVALEGKNVVFLLNKEVGLIELVEI